MIEQDIIDLVRSDEWMMRVIYEAEKLKLKEWAIVSGFIRNKVWDHLHGIRRDTVNTNDVDLVYFDTDNSNEENDRNLSLKMNGTMGINWDIINQAYTHKWHGHNPYGCTEEGIYFLTETPTSVGITMIDGELQIIAPHGIGDLVELIVRPSPSYTENLDLFYRRIDEKEWLTKWPKLKIVVN